MANIVVLLRNYKPYNSAVGICLENIIKKLKQENNIYIICEKTQQYQENYEEIDGEKIYRFLSQNMGKRFNKNGIKLIIYRINYNIKFSLQKYSLQQELIDLFYNKLVELNIKIDLVIPTCMPFESLIATEKYCDERKINYIPILFDKFADNVTLHGYSLNKLIKMKRHIKLEQKVLSNKYCKKILYVDAWEKHLNKINIVKNKHLIEHPLLVNDKKNKDFIINKLNFVYTGVITKKERNPRETLKIITSLIKINPNIEFNIYGSGDAINIILKFCKKYPKNIIYHGQVSTKEAKQAIAEATVLVSIGNNNITQTPSKIFEYMSTCKTIIHFAKKNNDPVLKILSKYKKSICFIKRKCINSKDNILKQIINLINQQIEYSELVRIFYNALPEYSANIIKSVIAKNGKETYEK